MLNDYHTMVHDQPSEGILERTPEEAVQRKLYLPHRTVIRENAEITKIRIVFHASAHTVEYSSTLNDCLDAGPLNTINFGQSSLETV